MNSELDDSGIVVAIIVVLHGMELVAIFADEVTSDVETVLCRAVGIVVVVQGL